VLRDRLLKRATDSEASIQNRLTTALDEIRYAKQPDVHDVVIVNGDWDRAYEQLKRVALGERVTGDDLPPLDDLISVGL